MGCIKNNTTESALKLKVSSGKIIPCCTSVLNLSVLCLAFHFQPSTQLNKHGHRWWCVRLHMGCIKNNTTESALKLKVSSGEKILFCTSMLNLSVLLYYYWSLLYSSVLNLSVLCLAFHFQPSTQSNYILPPLCGCSLTLVTVMKQWPDSQTSVWFVHHHLLSWNGGKTDLCAKQALQWKVRPQCKTSAEVKHADITHTHWLFQTAWFPGFTLAYRLPHSVTVWHRSVLQLVLLQVWQRKHFH